MSNSISKASAIKKIQKHGGLLVFPIKEKKKPESLWSVFYPRSTMRWEWDDDGDGRVFRLWHLRAELAESRQVIYTKWFHGRATVFRRNLFPYLYRALNEKDASGKLCFLSPGAARMLEALEDNSPLSTKQLKKDLGLVGSGNAAKYARYTKELFARLLIVGVGEIDDCAFPSLALGASKLYFEKEWSAASKLSSEKALKKLQKVFDREPLFYNQLLRYRARYFLSSRAKEKASSQQNEVTWKDLK